MEPRMERSLWEQRVTKIQKRLMIEYMKESSKIEDKKEKEEHWEKVQKALNEAGPPKKSLIQWKKIWRDMRCTTKKKLLEIKRTRPGSPCPVELTKEDHQIIKIVGASSDYFQDGGEGNELLNFEFTLPEEEPNEPALEESTISIPIETRRIKLPAPADDDGRGGIGGVYNNKKITNSFGMDDKVLQTLLESIAAASKIQKQKKELPDPDKLFLLSFVHALKQIPEDLKYDVKTDIINVFRKWQEKLGNGPPAQQSQSTSTEIQHNLASGSGIHTTNNMDNINQQMQLPSTSHNGGVQY